VVIYNTITILFLLFILDKGRLSKNKAINIMQLILFGSLLTIFCLYLIFFMYQFCFDSIIQCAADDKGTGATTPDIVNQAIGAAKDVGKSYIDKHIDTGPYILGGALGTAVAKYIPLPPVQKAGLILGVGTSAVFLGKTGANVADILTDNNIAGALLDATVNTAQDIINSSPHANPDITRVPSPGPGPIINSPLEDTEIIINTPLEALLSNMITAIH
jgi:hypothetical protein